MEEKLILETDMVMDKKTYRWIMTHFNKKNLVMGRILYALMPFYGLGMMLLFNEEVMLLGGVMVVVSLLLNYKHYISVPKRYDAVVEALERNHETENHYRFYETYVERTNASGNLIIKYENLSAFRENDSLLIFWIEPNKIIALDRKKVGSEYYDFLKGLVSLEKAAAYEKKVAKKRAFIGLLLLVLAAGFLGMGLVILM